MKRVTWIESGPARSISARPSIDHVFDDITKCNFVQSFVTVVVYVLPVLISEDLLFCLGAFSISLSIQLAPC